MVTPGVIRAVATADNHLSRFYDRMSPQKLARRRRYLRDAFKAVVDYALDWRADLFFIAGDLFDQPDPRNVDRAFVADCLRRLRAREVRVYAVSGNHDTPRHLADQGGTTPQEIYELLGALRLFESTADIDTDVLAIRGMRVAVGGLGPDPAAPPGTDPLAGITWSELPADVDVAILLLHGSVEGHAPDYGGPLIRLETLATLAGPDVFIAGDVHRGAVRRIDTRTLIIPGATERLTFGDDETLPGFFALELGRGGLLTQQRIPLPAQPRAEVLVRPADLDAGDLLGSLIAVLRPVCTPDTLVKVRLEGVVTRDQYHALAIRQLYEILNPDVFQLTVDTGGLLLEDEHRQVADRGIRVSQQDAIRAYTAEYAEENAEDPGTQELIGEAMQRILSRY